MPVVKFMKDNSRMDLNKTAKENVRMPMVKFLRECSRKVNCVVGKSRKSCQMEVLKSSSTMMVSS